MDPPVGGGSRAADVCTATGGVLLFLVSGRSRAADVRGYLCLCSDKIARTRSCALPARSRAPATSLLTAKCAASRRRRPQFSGEEQASRTLSKITRQVTKIFILIRTPTLLPGTIRPAVTYRYQITVRGAINTCAGMGPQFSL